MANIVMPVEKFVEELKAACERKDGYIMGSKGQNPKKWAKDSWWFTQYTNAKQHEKALYWRENAERVWDCNGMAEGIYEDFSGVDINTKARYNYANWCGTKGTGMIPTEYRVPGAAVFWGDKASKIHHVAYLITPVKEGETDGDWYIIEARGVMYGVVRTRLLEREPNFWGWMTEYFDYSGSAVTPSERVLRRGMSGTDVKEMQEGLIRLGYSCGLSAADGDFGADTEKALLSFQENNRLETDGLYGAESRAMMEKLLKLLDNDPEPDDDDPIPEDDKFTVTAKSVWLWTEPPVCGGAKTKVVHKDDQLVKADTGDYKAVLVDGNVCWINGKYVK